MGEFEQVVARLADADLLTEKQAAAYLGIEVDHAGRQQVASYLDISPSTLDSHTRAARDKVAAAEETLDIIEEYERDRYPPAPDECDECGGAIGGAFVRTEGGDVFCSDCGDVDSPREVDDRLPDPNTD